MEEWYKPENHFSGKELQVAQAIARNDRKEIKELIKKYNINVNFVGQTGYSFLLYAVTVERKKAMEALLELGADPNLECNVLSHPRFRGHHPYKIKYPIYTATYYSDLSYLKILLKYGANPDIHATVEKDSPLHNTIVNGKEDKTMEILKLLLDNGADINIQNAFLDTPLHTAAIIIGLGNNYEVFLYLLERGADPNIPNKYGETPAYIIQERLESYEKDGYRIPRLEAMIDTLKARGVKFPVKKINMLNPSDEATPGENKKENIPDEQVSVLQKQDRKQTWSALLDDDDIIFGN
jgi:ankyrin repeat protein